MEVRIAIEALEHAMESPCDLDRLSTAINAHGSAGGGTDALWRAEQMRKTILHERKAAKNKPRMEEVARQSNPSTAVAELEAAMAQNDLAILKAAIAEYAEAAEDTDELVYALQMRDRLVEERKAEKKKRLKSKLVEPTATALVAAVE